MKFIDKSIFPIPDILKIKGTEETTENKKRYKANKAKYTSNTPYQNSPGAAQSFNIDRNIYGHEDVKKTLIELQKKCCCFCESRITHISSGDVEHFRPKNGYTQNDDDQFHKPGYFWLAYDWCNLFYACESCNRRYKRNLFPLKDIAKRCNPRKSFDTSNEEPLFIDPSADDPAKHLGFIGPNIIFKTMEGDTTIRELRLDRDDLVEMRRASYNMMNTIKDLYEMSKGTPNENYSKVKFREILNEQLNTTSQYTLMLKCNFDVYIKEFEL